jgi:hypothetical protein
MSINPFQPIPSSSEHSDEWEASIELPPLPDGRGRSVVVGLTLRDDGRGFTSLTYEVDGIHTEKFSPEVIAEIVS